MLDQVVASGGFILYYSEVLLFEQCKRITRGSLGVIIYSYYFILVIGISEVLISNHPLQVTIPLFSSSSSSSSQENIIYKKILFNTFLSSSLLLTWNITISISILNYHHCKTFHALEDAIKMLLISTVILVEQYWNMQNL